MNEYSDNSDTESFVDAAEVHFILYVILFLLVFLSMLLYQGPPALVSSLLYAEASIQSGHDFSRPNANADLCLASVPLSTDRFQDPNTKTSYYQNTTGEPTVVPINRKRAALVRDWNGRKSGFHYIDHLYSKAPAQGRKKEVRRRCRVCLTNTNTVCATCKVHCCSVGTQSYNCFWRLHNMERFCFTKVSKRDTQELRTINK